MATYPIPWSYYVDHGWKTDSSGSGTVLETRIDTRSALIRTPKGPWRKPTNYSRVVETGRVATFDYSLRHSSHYKGYSNAYTTVVTGSGGQNGKGYYYKPIPALPQNLVDQAVIKCRLKLKNEHVNLAQAFAERGQTARLVSSNLKRLAGLVRNVKRMNLPKKEDFFSYWLETQYGWKPLISDVYGAIEHLHEREYEAGRGLVTVKAVAKDNFEIRNSFSGSTSSVNWSGTQVRRGTHKAFVRLDFRQSNAAPVGPFTQLGLTNPLYIAWELLPWSFVADWFIPVGDYLSQLDATKGWDFQGGSLSRVTRVKVHPVKPYVVPFDPKTYDRVTSDLRFSGKGRQMKFIRTAYTEPPTPTRPSYKKLNEKSNLHVANGIALLSNLILGKAGVR